ncbi:MAG: hypothetical protein HQL39_06270, partial [Alphaproteobacteria bacterium]|nr:hypothetical protein [Alphaproteobacteria bacterium]
MVPSLGEGWIESGAMAGGALSPAQARLYAECCQLVDRARDVSALAQVTGTMLGDLLRRVDDHAYRDKMQGKVREFFQLQARNGMASEAVAASLKHFVKQVVLLVITNHPHVAPPLPEADASGTEEDTLAASREATEIPEIEQPLAPTAIKGVPPHEAKICDSFSELLIEAICWRIDTVATFFHRANPDLIREMRRPFLLSPDFPARFKEVVRRFIIPLMTSSRSMQVLEGGRDWRAVDTAAFWEILEEEGKLDRLNKLWDAAWENYKLVREWRRDPKTQMRREVWVRKPELVDMREVLASPDYDIPAVKNEQIELFRALLTDFDRVDMENAWTKLRQTYEQEMDQRIYQEKARDGALRDSLLKCFDDFPDRLSEFLALLCYFTLPKLSISFLMKFTHNKGTNDDERNRKIPYLMRFLAQDGVAAVKSIEDGEEDKRQRAIADYRARLREA